jgi:hypothetical protein
MPAVRHGNTPDVSTCPTVAAVSWRRWKLSNFLFLWIMIKAWELLGNNQTTETVINHLSQALIIAHFLFFGRIRFIPAPIKHI